MVNYKTDYKIGDKVRILDVNNIYDGYEYWKTGDVTEVVELLNHGKPKLKPTIEKASNVGNYLDTHELQYIELVDDYKECVEHLLSLEDKIKVLEKRVEQLESKSNEDKVFNTGIHFDIEDKLNSKEFASKIIETLKKHNKEERLSNNELRKQVIDDAKELIDKHLEEQEFITMNVNKSYNMIVCTIMEKVTGNVFSGKYDISKDKCYNEHIGKAIAVSKALGLDYSKFENVGDPDEVVVGMKVRMQYAGSTETYTKTIDVINNTRVEYLEFGWDYISKLKEKETSILEDTNAKY